MIYGQIWSFFTVDKLILTGKKKKEKKKKNYDNTEEC